MWLVGADLRCVMEKASSSLGRASDTDMRNIKSTLRYLRGMPGIMTVRPTTLNLEAVKRAPVGSVLTYGDPDWAGDADRTSVSGTASWLRSKLGWYPITASSRKPSTIALSSGETELVAALHKICCIVPLVSSALQPNFKQPVPLMSQAHALTGSRE